MEIGNEKGLKVVIPDPVVWYRKWTKSLIQLNTAADNLLGQDWNAIYTQEQRDAMATDCFMLVSVVIPKIIEKAVKHGADVKPEFRDFVKKFQVMPHE